MEFVKGFLLSPKTRNFLDCLHLKTSNLNIFSTKTSNSKIFSTQWPAVKPEGGMHLEHLDPCSRRHPSTVTLLLSHLLSHVYHLMSRHVTNVCTLEHLIVTCVHFMSHVYIYCHMCTFTVTCVHLMSHVYILCVTHIYV